MRQSIFSVMTFFVLAGLITTAVPGASHSASASDEKAAIGIPEGHTSRVTMAASTKEGLLPSVFSSSSDYEDVEGLKAEETIRLSGDRLPGPPLSVGEEIARRRSSFPLLSGGKKKRVAVSMISSAILPGLGEFFLYLDTRDLSILARSIGFLALEGYLWYGYDFNHDVGKDYKKQYEDYGDAHWSEERFLLYHPVCNDIGGCEDWKQYNDLGPEAATEYFYFYYTPLWMDTEEYYENMGKYDAFLYGWDDWNGEYYHLGETPNYWTPHRTYFWSLRDESNKYLLRADQHIMGLIAIRLISMIHAGWVASRSADGLKEEEGWSMEMKNSGLTSRFGLKYSF